MKPKDKALHWDNMYSNPLSTIPWEIEDPPAELVELVESGQVPPGKVLDIGCGTGNYSFYLAKQGFDVTGIDFSKKALDIAQGRDAQLGLDVRFILGDIIHLVDLLPNEQFDFILDYSILHHIAPEDIKEYAKQFERLLKPGGKLLLVCFSDDDEDSAGRPSAVGKYGNVIYYRKTDEIRSFYKSFKELSYKKAKSGKRLHHPVHCFLFEK